MRIDSQGLGVNRQGKTSTDPYRVIESVWGDIKARKKRWDEEEERWSENEDFIALLESGHFVVTVVTAFEERAQRIRARMAEMEEEYAVHLLNVNAKKVGAKLTGKRLKIYQAFIRKGYPPRRPPRMEVHAIPDLFELMYPTVETYA